MRSKKFIYEVFWCREATWQGLSKYFQAFRFNQTMKRFRYIDRMHTLYELPDSLSYILCFTIYITLLDNPKYTLREVIVYHYRFLSSKAYQNRY